MENECTEEGRRNMEKTLLEKQRNRGGKSKEIRSKRGKKDTSNKNTRKEKNKDTEKLEINLINVNGLTKEKFAEIEKTFLEKELNILCMTETQLVQDKIRIDSNIEYFTAMREVNDIKGGGLMILHKKSEKMKFNKVDNEHNDILEIEGECNNIKMRIVLVYFGVKKSLEANKKTTK